MTIEGLALIIQSRYDPDNYFLTPNCVRILETIKSKFQEVEKYYISSRKELETILNRYKTRNIALLVLQGHGDEEKKGMELGGNNYLVKHDIDLLDLSNVQETVLHSCSLAKTLGVALAEKTKKKVWASPEEIYQIYLYFSLRNELRVLFSPEEEENNPYNLLAINNSSSCLEEPKLEYCLELIQEEVLKYISDNNIEAALNSLAKIETQICSVGWSNKYSDLEIEKKLIFLSNAIYFPLFKVLREQNDYLGIKNLLDQEISLSSAFKDKVLRSNFVKTTEARLLSLAELLFKENQIDIIYSLFYEPLGLSYPDSSEKILLEIIYGYIRIERYETAAELILNYITDQYLKDELMVKIARCLFEEPNQSVEKIVKLNEILSQLAARNINNKRLLVAEEAISLMTFHLFKGPLLRTLILKHLENENFEKAQELVSQISNPQIYRLIQQKIAEKIQYFYKTKPQASLIPKIEGPLKKRRQ